MADVFCVIPVWGREAETRATILSLAQNDAIDRLAVTVFVQPHEKHPDVTAASVEALLAASSIPNWTVESMPQLGWADTLQRAWTSYLQRTEPWFWWLENDNLVNPDCVDIMLAHAKQAAELRTVGLVSPQRLRGKGYLDDDPGPQYPFLFRKVIQGTVLFVRRQLAEDTEALGLLSEKHKKLERTITRGLYANGYYHVVPRKSTVQHIGVSGLTQSCNRHWVKYGCGGYGFVPHPRISEIASEIYEKHGISHWGETHERTINKNRD